MRCDLTLAFQLGSSFVSEMEFRRHKKEKASRTHRIDSVLNHEVSEDLSPGRKLRDPGVVALVYS